MPSGTRVRGLVSLPSERQSQAVSQGSWLTYPSEKRRPRPETVSHVPRPESDGRDDSQGILQGGRAPSAGQVLTQGPA